MSHHRHDAEASVESAFDAGDNLSPAESHRFRMLSDIASLTEDFYIQNDLGKRAYKVDGKAATLRDTLLFRDMENRVRCKIRRRLGRLHDEMMIEGPESQQIAKVRKTALTTLRDRYLVAIGEQSDIEVRGNVLAHEYRIGNIATVSKKWFHTKDSYGVDIAPGQDEPAILAATVCIDQMAREQG